MRGDGDDDLSCLIDICRTAFELRHPDARERTMQAFGRARRAGDQDQARALADLISVTANRRLDQDAGRRRKLSSIAAGGAAIRLKRWPPAAKSNGINRPRRCRSPRRSRRSPPGCGRTAAAGRPAGLMPAIATACPSAWRGSMAEDFDLGRAGWPARPACSSSAPGAACDCRCSIGLLSATAAVGGSGGRRHTCRSCWPWSSTAPASRRPPPATTCAAAGVKVVAARAGSVRRLRVTPASVHQSPTRPGEKSLAYCGGSVRTPSPMLSARPRRGRWFTPTAFAVRLGSAGFGEVWDPRSGGGFAFAAINLSASANVKYFTDEAFASNNSELRAYHPR